MSAHLERGRLLLAQSRAADAEQEAILALGQQPDDPDALALLALCRSHLDRHPAALEAAQNAVGLAPDMPGLHYVHALILHRMDRDEDAFRAVGEALRLAPDDPDYFSLLASIELARRKWPAALAAAEQALAQNPEHVEAANLRAMALVRLGRKAEAMATVDYALQRAPEDALSHANQGWNCLHQNDPAKAQEHFREALRLSPDLEYAREGMLEALKARNPVYRVMLAYFLWMGRLSGKLQWAFLLGVFFGAKVIRALAQAQPELTWFWWPLLGLFYTFVYLSWTAQPMFNLLLRFNRFGRHVLSADQRTGSNWFAAAFGLAVLSLVWWLGTGSSVGMFAMFVFAALSICLASTFNVRGRQRIMLGAATAVLAVCAVTGGLMVLNGRDGGVTLITVFSFGFLGFQFFANSLAIR